MNNLKKYLLERYPTVWNTHIIWILPLAIIAHFFFFGMGFLGLTDNVLADDYYYRWAENFEGLPLLLNFVISILLIVVWLIFVFKNNAFKHFYPIKRRQLLGQFVAYFVIVLSCISFFISFSAGEQVKVITKYTDSYIEAALEQCSIISDDSYNHSDNYNNYDEFTREAAAPVVHAVADCQATGLTTLKLNDKAKKEPSSNDNWRTFTCSNGTWASKYESPSPSDTAILNKAAEL